METRSRQMTKIRKTRNDVMLKLQARARRAARGSDTVGRHQLPTKNFISPVERLASGRLAPSITQITQTLDKFGS